MQKLASQKNIDYFLATLISFFLIGLKYSHLELPLVGDENYYALPFNWNYLENLSSRTFGHPPGWLLFMNLGYLIFGYSTTKVHVISVCASSVLMSYFFVLLRPIVGRVSALICVFLLVNHHYFLLASSLSHPVIACSLFGMCSLIHLSRGRYLHYAIFVSLALLTRESALVFPFAAVLCYREKKTILYSLPSVLLLASFYILHFLLTKKFLINSQMEYLLSVGQPVLIFKFEHILKFFTSYFIYSWYFGALLAVCFLLILKKKLFSLLKKDPFICSLVVAGFSHALFFSTYTHWAPRDIFISAAAIILACILILSFRLKNDGTQERFKVYFTSSIVLFLIVRSLYHVTDKGGEVVGLKLNSLAIQRLASRLTKIREEFPTSEILAGYPISIYISEPFMGYVQKSVEPIFFGGRDGKAISSPPHFVVHFQGFENKDYADFTYPLVGKYGYKEVYRDEIDPDKLIRIYKR